jgi:Mg-chelatase subunit ChlD
VIFFADHVQTPVALQPLSAARTAVRQELARVDGGGGTALLDGVNQALDILDSSDAAQNLKAMIVLTDGEENSSFRTLDDVERRLGSSGYLFFGIAYGGAAGRALLESLARHSGGHSLVTDEDGIETAYELLSQHM